MVSFSCEVCNDTLVKKKLKGHYSRCPNAYFTCIDCNTTFGGDDVHQHTQCISEAEKYGMHKGGKKTANVKKAEEPKKVEAPKKVQESKKEDKTKDKVSKDSKDSKIDISKLKDHVKAGKASKLSTVLDSLAESLDLPKKKLLKELKIVKNDAGEVVLKL